MSDGNSYFVSVMAADRPGLIALIGEQVDALGGTIEDLSQTVMQGFFTVLLLAHFPAGVSAAELEHRLQAAGDDLAVGVRSGGRAPVTAEGERFILSARGPDRPGVVGALGQFLAGRDIAIEDMYARREGAPASEYVMVLQLRCPPTGDIRQLQLDLSELADDLGMIAHLQHENVFLATNEIRAVRALAL